jgi:hypothetical protein
LDNIPYGYCRCGCGEKTRISEINHKHHGYVKGQPRYYVNGHRHRSARQPYIVEDRGHDTPCWIWQRSQVGNTGYGKLDHEGKTYRAHRFYYQQEHGPIPDGLELDHLCRQTACVNPDHLDAVSQKVNIRRKSNTKLTMKAAKAMRLAYQNGNVTQKELAICYGVTESNVSRILSGKTWV